VLVFAAFTPHTPLLVPSVGKTARERLSETVRSMGRLSDELYAAMPDTVVIVSAHAIRHENAFSVNLHDQYRVDLSEFGDLSASETFQPNLGVIDAVQRGVRRAGIPFTLDSDERLDYGAAVPLLLLLESMPSVKIVPVSYSGLDPKRHHAFGRALKDVLAARPERIAVIASGDLSHALTSDAPAGFRREGAVFDATVRQAVESESASVLLSMDASVAERASECGYRPLLVLLGLLENVRVRGETLSYEAPFGVGYLVAQFHIGG
jgi:aromatic ring-opening dioxygenase LigB subunit